MIRIRSFRNDDPPALASLWNRGLPEVAVSSPLSAHEFDTLVISKPFFEAEGLQIAERNGKILGFVHAGFGPDLIRNQGPLRLDRELGTIGMMVLEPELDDPAVEQSLFRAAEAYLRGRGSKVIYAGGQLPLNPFYWGVYGGSEWAGILSSHKSFQRAAVRAGFEPVSTTLLLEAQLSGPEIRDPRAAILRRQTTLESSEDVFSNDWWEAVAIGDFRPTRQRLLQRTDQAELAHATTWDMNAFGRKTTRAILGLIDLEVPAQFRRKGYGRHLVSEIMRQARGSWTDVVAVQTRSTNLPALNLYESLGFRQVESATLYRLPGGLDGVEGETGD